MKLTSFGRPTWRIAAALTAFAMLLSAAPAVAGLYPDPTAAVQDMSAANEWLQNGQAWAYHIYTFLLVFELVALTITTLLFRENLGEFFSSIGLKVLMGGVFMWFVVNAGTWAPAVIQTFKYFGVQLGGTASPNAFVTTTMASAIALYTAAGASLGVDTATADALSPICTFLGGTGHCPVGLIATSAAQHQTFSLLSEGVAFMMMMACAVVVIQFSLITIESYIVMGAGVLFIGFAGSRFTMPFSQGYFTYMINVGVKLMALYIILGLETTLLPNVLVGTAAAVYTCCVPQGGDIALVSIGAAAWVGFQVIIGAALIAAVPGLAASLLSGQSTVSGGQVVGQAMQGFAAAQQFAAQALASQHAQAQNHALHNNLAQLNSSSPAGSSTIGAQAARSSGAADVTQAGGMARADSAHEAFSSSKDGSTPLVAGSPSNYAPIGVGPASSQNTFLVAPPPPISLPTQQESAVWSGDSSVRGGLQHYGSQELQALSNERFDREASMTNWAALDNASIKSIADTHDLGRIDTARRGMEEQMGEAEMRQKMASGYALGALSGAVPREYAQPSAVQVRVSNPDKL